jgi:hypothetical protein
VAHKCASITIRRQLEDGTQPIRTSLDTATGYMIDKQLAATPPVTTAQARQFEQLYARYAADVDQLKTVVGVAKAACHRGVAKAACHRKIKGQRVRTAQQEQVGVRWKPTFM